MSWSLAPVAVVDNKNALELYASTEFISVARYPGDCAKVKKDEIGAIVVNKKCRTVPVLRIILKNS
jgi:hypothetical protein